jgi:hypothetical protein
MPGARVKDLYAVRGQAQKSARWRDRPNRMFQHMLRREKLRLDRGLPSRFERGTAALVKRLKASWQEYRYECAVRIVQPGLGSGKVDEEALHLLAATETYLFETRSMPPPRHCERLRSARSDEPTWGARLSYSPLSRESKRPTARRGCTKSSMTASGSSPARTAHGCGSTAARAITSPTASR